MTFDDALEKLMTNSYYLPNGTDDEFTISMKDAQDIILELRDTYIPTIEMTREEFTQFRFYLNNAKLLALLTDNSFGINQEDGENLFNRLTQEDLAQAWLYHECIKVVE